MSRLTYEITDDNKKRLNLLKAFATLDGKDPTLQDILNDAIADFFVAAYKRYCSQYTGCDMMRRAMENMLPQFPDTDTLQST